MVLIICQRFDPHVDFVEPELDRRGVPWARLHISDFPARITAAVRLGDGPVRGFLRLGKREILLEHVQSVWYRRTEPFGLLPTASASDRKLAQAECRAFIDGLWRMLGHARWVSPPAAIRDASSKAEQLVRARDLGFYVPPTCLSNDPEAIRAFWREHGRAPGVVYKPHTPILMRRADRKSDVVYTTLLDAKMLDHLDEIRGAPGIFQVLIPKQYDVRVTVIGRHVFACAIDSQSSEHTAIDWRGHLWSDQSTYPPHRPINLPGIVEEGCQRMVADYGLHYGAIDFAVDESGRYCFLEINPNGQWAFVEEATGLPLRSALCDLLSGET